jgi:hypothetical protein
MGCNDLIGKASTALALGKGERIDWAATLPATVVALANYHLFQLFNNPAPGTYPGAALTAAIVTGGTTPSLLSGTINFLDPTAPDRSYFLYGECLPQSATLGELIIFDLLAYYPGINMATAAPQALLGAASVLPARLASGRGVHLMIDTTVALGAGAATVVITYTNRLGVAGRVTPAFAMVPSSPIGRVPHSRYIAPLQAGDDGVQSAQTFDLSASMAGGTAALTLIKPLVSIPVPANFSTTSGIGQRSWFVDPLDITEILTGAALSAVFIPSAAVANALLLGHLKNVRLNPN